MSEGWLLLGFAIVRVLWLVLDNAGRCPECGSSSVCDDDCATRGRVR